MTAITIRDVRPAVRDALAARAAASGRSLQEYLSRELEALAERPDPDVLLERMRRVARNLPPVTPEEILADLHADRR